MNRQKHMTFKSRDGNYPIISQGETIQKYLECLRWSNSARILN